MFETVNNELSAYWLGFIYADGSLCGNRFTVELAKKDADHLNSLKKFMVVGNIRESKRKTLVYSYSCTTLSKNLINLGVIPRKTYENNSFVFDNVPNDLKHHFIRGFFDGDGTVGVYKNQIRFSFVSMNQLLLLKVSEFIPSKTNMYADSNLYRLTGLSNSRSFFFKDFIYKNSTICLLRKKEIFDRVVQKTILDKTIVDYIRDSPICITQLSKQLGINVYTIKKIKKEKITDYIYKYIIL